MVSTNKNLAVLLRFMLRIVAVSYLMFSCLFSIGCKSNNISLRAGESPVYNFSLYPIFNTPGADTEMSCVVKKGDIYYLFYHWNSNIPRFSVGVATSLSPYGPWTPSPSNPIIKTSQSTACFKIIEDDGVYWAIYLKGGSDIYLAKSDPSGDLTLPWTDYSDTPILTDFGYPGTILKVGNSFIIYSAYPIGSADQGTISIATASNITGPWSKDPSNPIIDEGEYGSWYQFGFSEPSIINDGNYYKSFLSGTPYVSTESVRNSCIGYGFSQDAINFSLITNPILKPEDLNLTYFSEPFTIVDSVDDNSLYLVYTTDSPTRPNPIPEYIGINAFSAVGSKFKISLPFVNLPTIAGSTELKVTDMPILRLGTSEIKSLKCSVQYDPDAVAGIRLHYYVSYDGVQYDNSPTVTDLPFRPGESIEYNINLKSLDLQVGVKKPRFIRILPENLDTDATHQASNFKVNVTVGQ